MPITPSSSNPSQPDSPNPRALAELFKLELDDMFNQWNAERPLRTGYPHASSILAPDSQYCLRQLVLAATQPEQAQRPEIKPWSAHENAVFLNGWVLHEKYQDLLSKYGQVVEVETSHFDEDRLLHFTPDGIITLCGMPFVVEIKGYKSSTFEKLKEYREPPEAAWMQCNLYCHLLGIQYGLVLVECKDTQEVKCWAITHDEKLALPYLDRLNKFKFALHKARLGDLPARCCKSKSDRLAEKCLMRNYCFSQG
jgi:hypothetical protein